MRAFLQTSLALALVTAPALAQDTSKKAQTPPATKGQPPAATKGAPAATKGAPAPSAPPTVPFKDEVVATVNGTEIKKSELIGFLSKFSIPPGNEQQVYQQAVGMLCNTELLSQTLQAMKIEVAPKDIDAELARMDSDLKRTQNVDLKTVLAETNTPMDVIRTRIGNMLRWKKYMEPKQSDEQLKKYYNEHQEYFDPTTVRASHILLMVKEEATPAEKEAIKQKLIAIKKDIDAKKIGFKDAANKYSEDPGNQETKAGGDLGFFPRKGLFVEPFAAAAFALKANQISEPVETQFGWHLIQVTDIKVGEKPKFEQVRDQILEGLTREEQERLVDDARKTAKIDIKPMPKDLFPPPPPGNPDGTLTPSSGATTKAATTKTTPPPATKAAGTPKTGR